MDDVGRVQWVRMRKEAAHKKPEQQERRELNELADALNDLNCEVPLSSELRALNAQIQARIRDIPKQ